MTAKWHLPESDNPVDTAHTVGILSINATWGMHSELLRLWFLRSVTDGSCQRSGCWLAGVFISLCYSFANPPLPRILCVICERLIASEEEKLSVPSPMVSADLRAAFCCVFLSSAVWHSRLTSKEEERFCPMHVAERQRKEMHLYTVPTRKSACLFFLIISEEKRKKQHIETELISVWW